MPCSQRGHPFSPSRGGYDRVEVLLDDDTDWQELAELLVDSYRPMAPKKLTRLLDQGIGDQRLRR